MKIVVIGASGLIGKAVSTELIHRGHQVIGIARHTENLPQAENFQALALDVNQQAELTQAFTGADAVINAFNAGWNNPNLATDYQKGNQAILQAAQNTPIPYFLFVGGAGTLYITPDQQLVDTPEFPTEIYPVANIIRNTLNDLKKNTQLNWAFVSPPAMFAVNPVNFEATGTYRLGGNQVLMNAQGQPADISLPDLAKALADDVEQKAHLHQHFTVAAA